MKTTSLRKTFGLLPLALCFLSVALAPLPVAAQSTAPSRFSFQQKYIEVPFIVTGQPVEKRTLGSFSLRGTLARRDLPLTAQTPVTVRVGDYTANVTFGNSAAPFRPNASSYTFNLPDGAVLRLALWRNVITWSLVAGDSIREMPALVESTKPGEAVPVRISIGNELREDAAPLLRGRLKYFTRSIASQTWRFASVNVVGSAQGLVVPAGKIKLWYAYDAGGAEEDALIQAVALLKKDQPKLEVTLERVPFGQFDEQGTIFDKWNKEVAAGGGPDMFTAPNDHTGAQVRLRPPANGVLAPLDRYLRVDAANFFPPARCEGSKLAGKIYGVPGIAKAVALYYNKSTIPNPPTTTAQLLQMVKDGKKIAINQNAYHSFGFLTGAFGGTLLNANGVCVANQGGFAPALQFLKDLKAAGASFNTDDSVSNQLFTDGAVDMTIQGPWKLGDFRDKLGDNLGVAKMPAGPAGAATPLAGVDYWYVNPNIPDKQKKLAVAVAMYLFGPKGAQLYSDVARSPMVTLGVKAASERVQTFADAAEAGFPRPQSTEFGNYWGPFGTAINEVLNDGADPVTAVQKATQAMNAANGK